MEAAHKIYLSLFAGIWLRRRGGIILRAVGLSTLVLLLIALLSNLRPGQFVVSSMQESVHNYLQPINPWNTNPQTSSARLDPQQEVISQDLCARTTQLHISNNVEQTIVLWPNHMNTSARRLLHSSMVPIQLDVERHESCQVYQDVPVLEHSGTSELQADQLIFGIATSKERFLHKDAIAQYWMPDSYTNIYVQLPKEENMESVDEIRGRLDTYGLASSAVVRDLSGKDQANQYARLAATMFELCAERNNSHVKWFIHLDDDTLLSSVGDYVRMLDKYDSDRPLYVGSTTESSTALARDGRGVWGGASIAISRPLAEQLSRHWEECLASRMDHTAYGDHKLNACVAYLQGNLLRRPTIQLEYSLHQLDMNDDIDGILRSGMQWLTMHHFSWYNMFPLPDKGPDSKSAEVRKIARSLRLLGSENAFSNFLLQHGAFGSVVLTNGYAITQYLVPMTIRELEMIELTFSGNGDHDGNLGPTRPPKIEGTEKKTYFISDVAIRNSEAGERIGSSWLYRHARDGKIEEIVVELMD